MAYVKREDMDPDEFIRTMSKTMKAETTDGRGDDEDDLCEETSDEEV